MIERQQDRRKSQAQFYDFPQDRRRPRYDRRGQMRVPAVPGTIRPAPGEAAPPRERRQVPGAGME